MKLGSRRPFFAPLFIAFLLSGALTGCATPRPPADSGAETQAAQGDAAGPHRNVETIVVLGTNDLHGTILPESLKTREEGDAPSVPYESGGAAYLASYVHILRDQLGSRLLWLDGGDEYQGSIESNSDRGASMVKFFNAAHLDAAAIGNHEFDFGGDPDRLGYLKARMSEAKYPYLAANIVDRRTGALEKFPNSVPSRIFHVGKLKVGVIGLSTLDTPKTTRAINVADLEFTPLKDATVRESQALRAAGADLVVVTAHVGLFCEPGRMPTGHTVRKATDPQGECGPNDEMVRLLRSLPAGTVDAVVSGHSHSVVYHWVAGVPVIQAGAYGRYLNLIYLSYDLDQKKLLTDRTLIEGPIPVCPKVFQNQNDCNGHRPAPRTGRGPLVPAKFRGQEIRPDSDVARAIAPAVERAAPLRAEPLADAARPIEHPRFAESPMGDLVSDGVRRAAGADFAIINSGGIRAPLEKGTITYGDLYRSLPFDNYVVKLRVTGRELLRILRIAESGSRGTTAISGLRLRLLDWKADAPATDLDGNGRIDAWEVNRLLEARTADGAEIDPDRTYTLATIDFLAGGGDDVGWALRQIPADRQTSIDSVMRDAVAQHLRELAKAGAVNAVDHPIVDKAQPRLIFETPRKKEKGKKSKGKRRRKARRAKMNT